MANPLDAVLAGRLWQARPPGGSIFGRPAITNPPQTILEQMQANALARRQADAFYRAFLQAGSQRNGVWKASDTGAYQMAKQQLFDKLSNQQLLEQKARQQARIAQMRSIA